MRLERGWTQKAVAQKVGLQLEVYRRYEKGIYEPPLSVVLKLVEIYDCSADYLLGLSRQRRRKE